MAETGRSTFILLFAKAFSVISVLIAIACLMSWFFGVEQTWAFGENYVPMAPSTAVLIVLLNVTLFFQLGKVGKTARCFAWITITICGAVFLVVLIRFFGGMLQAKIESLFSWGEFQAGGQTLGRMSLLTAVIIMISAIAIFFESSRLNVRFSLRKIAMLLGIAVSVASFFVFLSYAAGMPFLYDAGVVPMAFLTSLSLLFLGVGISGAAGLDVWPISMFGLQSPSGLSPIKNRIAAIMAVGGMVISAGIFCAGYFLISQYTQKVYNNKSAELSAISQIKADQISEWYSSEKAKCKALFGNKILEGYVSELINNSISNRRMEELRTFLERNVLSKSVVGIWLYDLQGKILLQSPGEANGQNVDLSSEGFAAAISSADICVEDLHLVGGISQGVDEKVRMSTWIPVVRNDAGRSSVIGVWKTDIDPSSILFPNIQTWPTPSYSAETLLIRSDGNAVVYLNKLRHIDNIPTSFRLPIDTNKSLPAAMVARGVEGIVEGIDYRGQQVLASVQRVAGTPWFIVSKIDNSEIYSGVHRQVIFMSSFVLLLILAVCFLGGFLWNQTVRNAIFIEKERLFVIVQSIGDGVIVTGIDGKITLMNKVAQDLTGWQQAEASGRPLKDVFSIINDVTGLPCDNPVEKVLSTGMIVGLANHTALICKDGTRRIIADSGAPVRDRSGVVSGVVLVFRDITEQHKMQHVVEISQNRYRRLFENSISGVAIHEIILDANQMPIDYVFLSVNQAFEQITGLHGKDIIGRRVKEILPGIEKTPLIQKYGNVVQTGVGIEFEEYFPPMGKWFNISAYKIGERQFGVVFNDVTTQKVAGEKTKAALELANARQHELSILLEGTTMVLSSESFEKTARILFDKAKQLIGATAGYVALLSPYGQENNVLFLDSGGLKCNVDQSLPMPIRGLRAESYHARQARYCNDFNNSQWVKFMPQGHVTLENVLFAPLVIDDKAIGLIGLGNKPGGFNDNDAALAKAFGDLAAIALKNSRSRQELVESEERFRDVVDSHSGVVWETNDKFIVTYISGRVQEIFGYHPDEILGRSSFFIFDPEDKQRMEDLIQQLPQTHQPIHEIEYWCRAKDGRRVRISSHALPYFDSNGRLMGYRGSNMDVTEAYWARRRRDVQLQIHQLGDQGDAAISTILCEACAYQADSPMSFFGMVEPDQSAMVAHVWSPKAMVECRVPDKPLHFPLKTAGLWAEPIRQQKPIMVNDYSSSKEKCGLPTGHVAITRYLGVPIVRDGKVLAVAGVANKSTPYSNDDLSRLSLLVTIVADYLATRRAAKDARESDRRLRTFIDFTADWEYWRRPDGRHIYDSPSCLGITGYSAQEFQDDPGLTARIVHPDDREMFERHACEVAKDSGSEMEIEFRIIRKDAQTRWIQHRCRPIQTVDGSEFSGTRVSNRDVTEQKLAQQDIRLSEERLRQAQKMAHVGSFEHDLRTNEMRWSQEMYQILEVNPDNFTLTYDAMLDIIHPDDRKMVDTTFTHSLENVVPISMTCRLLMKDGRVKYVHVEIGWKLGDDGKAILALGTVQDITKLKSAEMSLKESQQRLELAAKSAGMGIWDWDVPNNRMTWDKRMFELYGVNEDSGQHGVEIWEKGLHPDDKVAAWEACQDALAGRKEYNIEFRIVRPDSTVKWIHANGMVLRDADGKAVRMLGTNCDITDRRMLEDQLRQIEKMRAIEQLAGGIAHDFNNQLTGIMGFTEIIKRTSSEPKICEHSEKILSSGRRAADLVKQLLAFSRKGQYQNKAMSLGDVVREVVDILERTIPKNIEIITSLNAVADVVIGDKTQIQNAILNLGINARDAMPSGGVMSFVSGTILADEKYCTSQSFDITPGNYVWISVCDIGCGIPSEDLSRIFEPFFTTKGEGQGTGLGLPSVYGTVKNHGGAITVKSQVGKGSVFTIYLPQNSSAAKVDVIKPNAVRKTRKLSVMVVDDEVVVGQMACEFLGELGHESKLLTSGAEAIEYYAKNFANIDLSILDMAMPKIDGRQVFSEIRKINPSAKVIIATGYSIFGNVNKLMEEGVAALLQKPYSFDQIADAIAKVLTCGFGSE